MKKEVIKALQFIKLLENTPSGVFRDDIKQKLDLSERAFYRLLSAFREAGYNIECIKGKYRRKPYAK